MASWDVRMEIICTNGLVGKTSECPIPACQAKGVWLRTVWSAWRCRCLKARLSGAVLRALVGDDAAILRLARDKLDRAGFEVSTASSGQQALDLIAERGLPHLVIVDLMMPGVDGFEFCQAIQQYTDLPVIMLTAIDEEETVIRGIWHFAEDYITKPFSPRELVARVERVLRRIGDFAYALGPVMQVDSYLAVDFAHQRVIVDGHTKDLTPTETKILYILMRNAGHTA